MLFITLLCVRKWGNIWRKNELSFILFLSDFKQNYVNIDKAQILFSLTSLKRERELVGTLEKKEKKKDLPVI